MRVGYNEVAYQIRPIARVHSPRLSPEDDFWGGQCAEIVLESYMDSDCLLGLDAFSHVEILYIFDQVETNKIVYGARHPRNNLGWPKTGILAQRAKNRPNRIGSTICQIIDFSDRSFRVAELDAIEGTPVIDIKPVMREFLPREAVTQPKWASSLMEDYWRTKQPTSEAKD